MIDEDETSKEKRTKMESKKIIAYLQDQLDHEESAAFERQMKKDKKLAEEVAAYAGILKVLREKELENTLVEIDRFESSLPAIESEGQQTYAKSAIHTPTKKLTRSFSEKPDRNPLSTIKNWVAIAAAVVLIATIGYRLWFPPVVEIPPQSAKTNYIQPDFIKFMSGDEDYLQFKNGLEFFASGQFPQAIEALRGVSDASSIWYPRARYVLAHAFFQNEQYANTLRILEDLLLQYQQIDLYFRINDSDKKAVTVYDMEWLKLLSLIGAGRRKKALDLLSIIIENEDHPYWEEALKIELK